MWPTITISILCYFVATKGATYCDQRVRLSVCLLVYLKNHMWKLYKIFCTCYLWPWLGPPLTAMQYVVYFRFCVWRHIFTQQGMWCTARLIRPRMSVSRRQRREIGESFSSALSGLRLTGRQGRRTQRSLLCMEVTDALRTRDEGCCPPLLRSLLHRNGLL